MLLIGSSPLLIAWGTAGHVDVLGLAFALAAFYCFSLFQARGRTGHLALAAIFLIAAVFTKQTMIASGAAITLLLAMKDRKRAVLFAAATGGSAAVLALALNHATGGRFFDNAVIGNLNPFSAGKALQQASQLLVNGGCLAVLAAAGLRRAVRGGVHPLYVYLGCAVAVLAVTAPKVGSDLNYQLETVVLLGLCAAWALDRLGYSPAWFRSGLEGPALLGILPLLQLMVNLMFGGSVLFQRWAWEPLRRQEQAQLAPYLQPDRGRVLSVEIDPLLHSRGRIEVEPLIYTLLVDGGRVNPEPVRRDLACGQFSLVVLFDDLFDPAWAPLDREIPSLPRSQLQEIRKHYRLVGHIAGPYQNGDYLYAPIQAANR
jgi:hypothetical protein